MGTAEPLLARTHVPPLRLGIACAGARARAHRLLGPAPRGDASFVALLAGRRAWRIFLLLATIFHLVNALVLNIAFTSQAITYLAFVDLTSISDAAMRFVRRWSRQLAVLAGAVAAWHVTSRTLGKGSSIVLITSPQSEVAWILYISLPLCALVFGLLAIDLRGRGDTPAPLSASGTVDTCDPSRR